MVKAAEFMNAVRRRRSIRKYKLDPIPEKKLRYVLEAACAALSWENRQCWKYIIVTDEAPEPRGRRSLEEITGRNHW